MRKLQSLKHQFLFPALQMVLAKEIDFLRDYPHKRIVLKNFNPRSSDTCFIGLGFLGTLRGYDKAREYREAVGSPNNRTSNSIETFLEIWSYDHWLKYPQMVKAVVKYVNKTTSEMPELLIDPEVSSF